MLAIGMDVGRSMIKAGVVDNEGTVLNRIIEQTVSSGEKEEVIDQVIKIAERLLEKNGEEIFGMGIGFAGRVNGAEGIVIDGTNFSNFKNVEISKLICGKLPISCFLENDVKVKAMAEKEYGAARPFSDFIYMAMGTGIGGAIFVNGALFCGRDGLAGEVGHIIVEKDGAVCGCGGKGCFEAVVRQIRDEKRDPKTMEKVSEVVANVLTGLIHTINPEAVIIGGGVAKAGKYLFNPLKKKLSELVMPDFYKNISILPGELGDDGGIIGSGLLALRNLKENYVA